MTRALFIRVHVCVWTLAAWHGGACARVRRTGGRPAGPNGRESVGPKRVHCIRRLLLWMGRTFRPNAGALQSNDELTGARIHKRQARSRMLGGALCVMRYTKYDLMSECQRAHVKIALTARVYEMYLNIK